MVSLEAGNTFYASIGMEHSAYSLGEARILVNKVCSFSFQKLVINVVKWPHAGHFI